MMLSDALFLNDFHMIKFADANWHMVQFCGRKLAKRKKEIDNKGGQMPTFSMRAALCGEDLY